MNETEKIIDQIQRKASVYTKEWRMDRDNPDIGTAVALVYADMFAETVKRFWQIPLKMRQTFFNEQNASLLPAQPSAGYVQFSLVNEEVDGTMVPKGTIVSGEAEQEEISFETKEELFTLAADIDSIYQIWDTTDSIYKIYDKEIKNQKIALFSEEYKNLQEHSIYFCHDNALLTTEDIWVEIEFYGRDEGLIRQELLKKLADQKNAEFYYSSKEGFVPFASWEEKNGRLLLYKKKEDPAFEKIELEGVIGGFIQCRIINLEPIRDLYLSKAVFSSWNEKMVPENIFGNGLPCDSSYFLPFGEEPSVYSEVYFGCGDVLNKKGADIKVCFCLESRKTPYGNWDTEEMEWNWIMKKVEKKKEIIFETSIETVLWEYYNGKGWKCLFTERREGSIFSKGEQEDTFRSFHFRCPEDIEPTLINACETYYIRARILKVNNPYKAKGYYLFPVISNMHFSYQYIQGSLYFNKMLLVNNIETKEFDGNRNLFSQTGYDNHALYLGFKKAPIGSPIRFLLTFEEYIEGAEKFDWEYFGSGKWKELNLIDETNHLTRTGIVTWNGREDFTKQRLFGEERFWIRIMDHADQYGENGKRKVRPILTGIYPNTTKAVQMNGLETEYFTMDTYLENATYTLLNKNIYHLDLWVKEDKTENMKDSEHGFIKWQQVADFADSNSSDRHFVLQQIEGIVLFGDGRKGKIPPASKIENIKMQYRFGGGEKTNLPIDSINKISVSLGFINRATNPLPFVGGQDIEDLENAIVRSAAAIRHQNRAVTARDFEMLALQACRDILAVRCICGRNGRGKEIPGMVTLVLLLKDIGGKQNQFPTVQKELFDFFRSKADSNLIKNNYLCIREPQFAKICVQTEVATKQFDQVSNVKEEIKEILKKMFTSREGVNQKNFMIRRFPDESDIRNAIYGADGVSCIKRMYTRVFIGIGEGLKEVTIQMASLYPYVQFENGKHEINVQVE